MLVEGAKKKFDIDEARLTYLFDSVNDGSRGVLTFKETKKHKYLIDFKVNPQRYFEMKNGKN